MIENFSVGVDIVDIIRFKKKKFSSNNIFYRKIFTESEIEYCTKFKDSYRHFAVKFAIKEAVIKAIDEKLNFLDIISDHKNKKPIVKITNKNQYFFKVSVSHEENIAIAIVICEKYLKKMS